MQKIINAHCHIYPEKIASKAVLGIRDFYDLNMSLDGTVEGLLSDGGKVGVTHYLIHPLQQHQSKWNPLTSSLQIP